MLLQNASWPTITPNLKKIIVKILKYIFEKLAISIFFAQPIKKYPYA